MNHMTQEQLSTSGLADVQQYKNSNPLLSVAMPIIAILIRIATLNNVINVIDLRNGIIQELRVFEERMANMGCEQQILLAARYCLCTVIDEAVLKTPWGRESAWTQQSLLSIVHKETWGGERFFIILDHLAADAGKNIHFLELIYVLLSLGYQGKYHEQGEIVVNEIRYRLFQRIKMYREYPDTLLSDRWKSGGMLQKTKRHFSGWSLAIGTGFLAMMMIIGFRYATSQLTYATLYDIEQLNPIVEQAKGL